MNGSFPAAFRLSDRFPPLRLFRCLLHARLLPSYIEMTPVRLVSRRDGLKIYYLRMGLAGMSGISCRGIRCSLGFMFEVVYCCIDFDNSFKSKSAPLTRDCNERANSFPETRTTVVRRGRKLRNGRLFFFRSSWNSITKIWCKDGSLAQNRGWFGFITFNSAIGVFFCDSRWAKHPIFLGIPRCLCRWFDGLLSIHQQFDMCFLCGRNSNLCHVFIHLPKMTRLLHYPRKQSFSVTLE